MAANLSTQTLPSKTGVVAGPSQAGKFQGSLFDRVAQLEVVLCVGGCMRLWSFARDAEDRGEDRGD